MTQKSSCHLACRVACLQPCCCAGSPSPLSEGLGLSSVSLSFTCCVTPRRSFTRWGFRLFLYEMKVLRILESRRMVKIRLLTLRSEGLYHPLPTGTCFLLTLAQAIKTLWCCWQVCVSGVSAFSKQHLHCWLTLRVHSESSLLGLELPLPFLWYSPNTSWATFCGAFPGAQADLSFQEWLHW